MRIRAVLVIAFVALALVVLAFAKQPPPAPASATERYHLNSFQIGHDNNSRHELFLVDSQTGQVWRYMPTGQLAQGVDNIHIWKFFPVEVSSTPAPARAEKPAQTGKEP